ncbi:MAG: isocitrate lyase/PEP mutase family protein [Ilumatobacteraceae bacterium]
MKPQPSLREKLSRGEMIVAPGIFDPLGALLVERLGFDAVYMGGWATGSHLGVTEPLLTMTEQVEAARRVVNRVGIPLIVDADAGFGEPLHTQRTVREFEAAGVAAIHIEDQHHPKRAHYHRGIEEICDRETFLQKIRVALEARESDHLAIIARTDAANARNGDVQEAIWRCQAALDLGADAVMPLTAKAVPTLADDAPDRKILEVRAGLPDDACVVLLAGHIAGVANRSVDEYRDLGFRMVLFPIAVVMVYVGALRALYGPLAQEGRLRQDGLLGFPVSAFSEVQALVEDLLGFERMVSLEVETVESARG